MFDKDTAKSLASGLVAGAVATFAMKGVNRLLRSLQSTESEIEEDWAEIEGMEERAIQEASDMVGVDLSSSKEDDAVEGVHWALGTLAGVAQSRVRRHLFGSEPTVLQGVLWGVGTFVVLDAVLKPAFGVNRGWRSYPWQTHARRLAGHAVYGGTNAAARQLLPS